MRICFLLFLLIANRVFAQNPVWPLKVVTLQGSSLVIQSLKGKKILVATVSPQKINNGKLEMLQSVQLSYPGIAVILVPALDFWDAGANLDSIMTLIKVKENGSVIIAAPSFVKKNSQTNQGNLISWLTHVSGNGHFDADVIADEQVFLISSKGVLFGEIQAVFSREMIDQLLAQQDITL